jgi:hypothetical protein
MGARKIIPLPGIKGLPSGTAYAGSPQNIVNGQI